MENNIQIKFVDELFERLLTAFGLLNPPKSIIFVWGGGCV